MGLMSFATNVPKSWSHYFWFANNLLVASTVDIMLRKTEGCMTRSYRFIDQNLFICARSSISRVNRATRRACSHLHSLHNQYFYSCSFCQREVRRVNFWFVGKFEIMRLIIVGDRKISDGIVNGII